MKKLLSFLFFLGCSFLQADSLWMPEDVQEAPKELQALWLHVTNQRYIVKENYQDLYLEDIEIILPLDFIENELGILEAEAIGENSFIDNFLSLKSVQKLIVQGLPAYEESFRQERKAFLEREKPSIDAIREFQQKLLRLKKKPQELKKYNEDPVQLARKDIAVSYTLTSDEAISEVISSDLEAQGFYQNRLRHHYAQEELERVPVARDDHEKTLKLYSDFSRFLDSSCNRQIYKYAYLGTLLRGLKKLNVEFNYIALDGKSHKISIKSEADYYDIFHSSKFSIRERNDVLNQVAGRLSLLSSMDSADKGTTHPEKIKADLRSHLNNFNNRNLLKLLRYNLSVVFSRKEKSIEDVEQQILSSFFFHPYLKEVPFENNASSLSKSEQVKVLHHVFLEKVARDGYTFKWDFYEKHRDLMIPTAFTSLVFGLRYGVWGVGDYFHLSKEERALLIKDNPSYFKTEVPQASWASQLSSTELVEAPRQKKIFHLEGSYPQGELMSKSFEEKHAESYFLPELDVSQSNRKFYSVKSVEPIDLEDGKILLPGALGEERSLQSLKVLSADGVEIDPQSYSTQYDKHHKSYRLSFSPGEVSRLQLEATFDSSKKTPTQSEEISLSRVEVQRLVDRLKTEGFHDLAQEVESEFLKKSLFRKSKDKTLLKNIEKVFKKFNRYSFEGAADESKKRLGEKYKSLLKDVSGKGRLCMKCLEAALFFNDFMNASLDPDRDIQLELASGMVAKNNSLILPGHAISVVRKGSAIIERYDTTPTKPAPGQEEAVNNYDQAQKTESKKKPVAHPKKVEQKKENLEEQIPEESPSSLEVLKANYDALAEVMLHQKVNENLEDGHMLPKLMLLSRSLIELAEGKIKEDSFQERVYRLKKFSLIQAVKDIEGSLVEAVHDYAQEQLALLEATVNYDTRQALEDPNYVYSQESEMLSRYKRPLLREGIVDLLKNLKSLDPNMLNKSNCPDVLKKVP